jgi:hypothetical protein
LNQFKLAISTIAAETLIAVITMQQVAAQQPVDANN